MKKYDNAPVKSDKCPAWHIKQDKNLNDKNTTHLVLAQTVFLSSGAQNSVNFQLIEINLVPISKFVFHVSNKI